MEIDTEAALTTQKKLSFSPKQEEGVGITEITRARAVTTAFRMPTRAPAGSISKNQADFG